MEQDLRRVCKDLKCAQYGDKATIIKRILDNLATSDAQVEVGNPPTEDAEGKDYHRMKKPQYDEEEKKLP